MAKTPKRPHDPNQLAKRVADLATGEVREIQDTNQRAKAVVDGVTHDATDKSNKVP